MKKQIQTILLMLFLSAGLAACSGSKSNNQSDSTNASGGPAE
jgi:ABC-type glycerol-3-phosphate transport system substrate-binding protein